MSTKSFNSSVLDSTVNCFVKPHPPFTITVLQFFCFRFVYEIFDNVVISAGHVNFNSSVLDSDSWFYLPLFKFFPALFMIFVRGTIHPPCLRSVKSLTV